MGWIVRKWRRREFSPLRAFVSGITFLCVWSAFLAAIAWHRSNSTLDNIVYARGGSFLEVTSLRGMLVILSAKSWPAETPPARMAIHQSAFSSRPGDDQYFYERNAFSGHTWGSLWNTYQYISPGIRLDLGIAFGGARDIPVEPFSRRSGIPRTLPVNLWGITYQAIILIFMSFPIFRIFIRSASAIRRRIAEKRRSKSGLCPNCSYDLRAHSPGGRCPECGAVISMSIKSN